MGVFILLKFIEAFKGRDKGLSQYIVKCFTEGNCYHFAVILERLFPGGHIIYDTLNGHFLYNYQGLNYDINGINYNVAHAVSVNWIILNDPILYIRLLRDCIYKKED